MKTIQYLIIATAFATTLGPVSVYGMDQDHEQKEAAAAQAFTPEEVAQANRDLLDAIIDHNIRGVTQALIDGAQVNQADIRGITPLSHACSRGNITLAQLLLNHGATETVNQADHHGFTPLLDSCIAGKPALLKILAFHGATLSRAGEESAIRRSMPESIRSFMEQGRQTLYNCRAIIEQAQEARSKVGNDCLTPRDIQIVIKYISPTADFRDAMKGYLDPFANVQDRQLRKLIKMQILKNRQERFKQERHCAQPRADNNAAQAMAPAVENAQEPDDVPRKSICSCTTCVVL